VRPDSYIVDADVASADLGRRPRHNLLDLILLGDVHETTVSEMDAIVACLERSKEFAHMDRKSASPATRQLIRHP
jgi:hypothetical protein